MRGALLLLPLAASAFTADHTHLLSLQQVMGQLDLSKYAVEGAIAGGCRGLARGLTFPFDTIKTLEQVDKADALLARKDGDAAGSYWTKIFRGIGPAVVSAVPANAAFFVVYKSLEVISAALHPIPSKLLERIVISSIATLPQNSIKIPFENVKQKMQTCDMTRAEIVASILRYQGVGGFFVGGNAQLLRELPYNAIQMSAFEVARELYRALPLPHLSELGLSAASGFLACALAALLTQPADVVKTRIMAGDEALLSEGGAASSRERTGLARVCRDIYAAQGAAGFFVGLQARLALVSIGGMIYFWAAELVEEMYK